MPQTEECEEMNQRKYPFGEDVNYWKTGSKDPETIVDEAVKLIQDVKGKILARAYGMADGREGYMLQFQIGEDVFKVVWPVLPVRRENDQRAARRQAATFLRHDIKARCMTVKIFGARHAFFQFLMLPDGRTAGEAASPHLIEAFPQFNALPAPEQL